VLPSAANIPRAMQPRTSTGSAGSEARDMLTASGYGKAIARSTKLSACPLVTPGFAERPEHRRGGGGVFSEAPDQQPNERIAV